LFNLLSLSNQLRQSNLNEWAKRMHEFINKAMQHGDNQKWRTSLELLPPVKAKHWQFDKDQIEIGANDQLDDRLRARLRATLLKFHPWRKGPFNVFGLHIDSEWRSDWKWRRFIAAIDPLKGRRVLDVGCGNGYYALRCLGQGAAVVVGIEPQLLYHAQYQALQHFLPDLPLCMLPCTLEDLEGDESFDSVFSLGVIYHRKSPLDHLNQLLSCLRPGGQLVIETLAIENKAQHIFMPVDRYARMRNIWFIPSPECLLTWLERSGFKNPRVLDLSITSPEEQRQTEWMSFESLAHALHPKNPGQTVEGLPAPRRVIAIAEK
jgi:tRNA (mo5U34)-methyltransferase